MSIILSHIRGGCLAGELISRAIADILFRHMQSIKTDDTGVEIRMAIALRAMNAIALS
jgi:hypothetical protein